MHRHAIDTTSAALGVVAVGAGVLVMTDAIDRIDSDSGWWFAVAALVVGLGLIPWNRSSTAPDADQAEAAGAADELEEPVDP